MTPLIELATDPIPGKFKPAPASSAAPRCPAQVGFKSATRRQESLLAVVERRLLIWLAERAPTWLNSDHLTALGFAAMIFAGASYALARSNRIGFVLATVALAVNWLGDSLDGTLARVRNRQRPRYGFYVDHILDSFGALFLMGGLALSGKLDPAIAAGMLVGFLLLSIESYLATYTLGEFKLSYAKFSPTEIRLLLACANIVLWWRPDAHAFKPGWRLMDFGGCVSIAGMAAMLVVTTVRHMVQLYREERLPKKQ